MGLIQSMDEWLGVVTCTEPANRPQAQANIAAIYEALGEDVPEFVWCDSDKVFKETVMEVDGRDELGSNFGLHLEGHDSVPWITRHLALPSRISDSGQSAFSLSSMGGPIFDASPHKSIFYGQFGVTRAAPDRIYSNAFIRKAERASVIGRTCGPFMAWAGLCLVMERPYVLKHIKETGRLMLHCEDGPALEWRDGSRRYIFRDREIPSEYIEHPDELDANTWLRERNQEVRRFLMQKIGEEKVLSQLGAKMRQKDDYGELWQTKNEIHEAGSEAERLTMVKVINSTPEPDGTFKAYWLRVPPETKRAKDGVAWTFGKDSKGYKPSVET